MNLTARNSCLFVFLIFSKFIFSQPLVTPSDLSASYKKYTNRIELTWEAATTTDYRYIILRRERSKKVFSPLDTVRQNRYVDRNNLQLNTEYIYRVQSTALNGTTSAPSKDAIGALLSVADDHSVEKDSLHLEHCLRLTLTNAKSSPTLSALRFLAETACDDLNTIHLSLYHSVDSILDDADLLLNQQSFDPSRKRGSITAKNTLTKPLSGYLILRASSEDGTFYVVRKID